MEVKYEKHPYGIVQVRKRDGKRYICLYELMRIMKAVQGMGGADSKPVHINGEIIYAPMLDTSNYIYTAFLEENAAIELIEKTATSNN